MTKTNALTPTSSISNDVGETAGRQSNDRPPWLIFASFLVTAIAVLALLAWSLSSTVILFVELLIAAGAASVGVLLGFLFGMPRGFADDRQDEIGNTPPTDVAYRPSNNLEQVSDWLTKILIGVGLVELGQLRETLRNTAQAVEVSIAAAPAGTNVVTQVVVVTFLVLGFLASFLWTRIYYGPLQTRVDRDVISSLRGRLKQEKEEKEKAVLVAHSLATGEIAVPSITPVTEIRDARFERLDLSDWPEEVIEKIEEFKKSPSIWDSDPADRLFPTALEESQGRRLGAAIVLDLKQALVISLRVRRTAGESLTGVIVFLLHPTFSESVLYVEADCDTAEAKISSAGWFTVVAIMDRGNTVLKYNLKQLPNAPAWFK